MTGSRSAWLAMAVLLLQHLLLFWPHYTGDATFYRDFTNIYYPLTTFWISLVKEGVFPHWAPFANLGLPFILTMQSGIFYPPFWLFTWSDALPYTLQAANVVLALHVLGGAIGAWCYARLLGMSIGAACLVAVAFQFMGCLYNNLQHPDMIQAYAYLPWLFWSVHFSTTATRLSLRHWLLPLLLCLFVTGAYQGNLIAHSFVLVVWCLLCWLRASLSPAQGIKIATRLYGQLAGLAVLGLLLAAVYLWPTYQLMDYQSRSEGTADFRHYWDFTYWHTLIMPSNIEGIYVWQAMISAFITVPVFCLLFFVRFTFLRKEWPLVAMTTLSVLLAAGFSTPVYKWLVEVFPMLGYSRLLSSDYRGLFCFGLILLAGKLLDDYLQGKMAPIIIKRSWLCLGVLGFYLIFGLLGEQFAQASEATLEKWIGNYHFMFVPIYYLLSFHAGTMTVFYSFHWIIALILAAAVWSALYLFRHRQTSLLVVLIFLTLLSGFIQWRMERDSWQLTASMSEVYPGLRQNERLPVLELLQQPLPERPPCLEGQGYWPAYLLGKFVCHVKDALNVKPRVVVNKMPILYDYMVGGAKPLPVTARQLSTCEPEWLSTVVEQPEIVEQISYGLQDIHYKIHAADNLCFVTTGLFFPGWSGAISTTGENVQAQSYCDALRVWCVPAGEYTLDLNYETPGLRSGFRVSLLALAVYGWLLGVYGWRRLRA